MSMATPYFYSRFELPAVSTKTYISLKKNLSILNFHEFRKTTFLFLNKVKARSDLKYFHD